MRLVWSLPVPGETLDSPRGDIVRARNLIQSIRAEGHHVEVVAAGSRSGTAAAVSGYRTLVRRLPVGGTALRDVGRLLLARRHADRVAAASAALDADAIIETQVHMVPSGARAARRAALPFLLDDCSPPSEEAALGAGLSRVAGRLFRAEAAAAAVLVASSRALADRLVEEGAPREKLRLVPNGVDASRFDGTGADLREAVRHRWGAGAAPVVVYVGSFQPWHRVDRLVDALPLLDADVRLALLGDGVARGRALDRALELGVRQRVVAPGAVSAEEVAAALAACDVAALPGTNDYGQPMKLLEYAAAGLPAVAPDLPPVRDVVRAGETALLFPPGDPEGLLGALRRLLEDPALRRRMGSAARTDARSDSRSWRAAARALLAALPVGSTGGRR